ncbi:hypothetical protein ANTRET_LOCUS5621 [Anthophora retusa]
MTPKEILCNKHPSTPDTTNLNNNLYSSILPAGPYSPQAHTPIIYVTAQCSVLSTRTAVFRSVRCSVTLAAFAGAIRHVYIDSGMGIRTHCQYLSDKVGLLFGKLARLARCRWGLRFGTLSTIYRGAVLPVVTYAAAGWSDLCGVKDLSKLRSMQRRVLIAMTSAYRRASWEALCVVAGVVPVDVLLQQHRALYALRKGRDAQIGQIRIQGMSEDAASRVREEALNLWQSSWTSSHKSCITYAYYSGIREQLAANWMKPNHFTTQALTGHGNFQSRLLAYGVVDDEVCVCGSEADNVGHFILECPLYDPQREALEMVEVELPEAAPFLVSSAEAFSVFAGFCEESLYVKGFDR